jgi:hypothetical protein
MAGDADGAHMDVKPFARRLAQSLLSAVTSERPAEVMRHLCIPAIGRIKARAKDDC